MKKVICWFLFLIVAVFNFNVVHAQAASKSKPNIVLIYTDDVGFGDVSCYGTSAIATPNIDRLAKNGVRFTNAHATSATCTPSRFSLLTGKYAWRKAGTGECGNKQRTVYLCCFHSPILRCP
jgi:hypothetical protein